MDYKLSKAIMIDGKETKEITYDFENLTGRDIGECIKELQNLKHPVLMAEGDQQYHVALFAKAAGMTYLDLAPLSAKDFINVGVLARNFFFFDLDPSLENDT